MPETVIARWQREAEIHQQSSDYDWMAGFVTANRVLEIGCGAGFATQSLCERARDVLSIEPSAECIRLAQSRCSEASIPPRFLETALADVSDAQFAEIESFAPEWIVCWLMGADTEQLVAVAPDEPARQVQVYREQIHRQVFELAASLPGVVAVHLVDRTAFPWKIKDSARDTLLLYHGAKTFAGLPFTLSRDDALYRKLDVGRWSSDLRRSGMGGVIPVLASVVARSVAAATSN